MYKLDDIRNTLIQGNTLSVLKQFPDECVDMVITSPPYWNLRDYKLEPRVWGGDEDCEHKFPNDNIKRIRGDVKNFTNKPIVGSNANEYQSPIRNNGSFCSLCGAWKGSLGLEPNFGDTQVEVELMELRKDLMPEEIEIIKKELPELFT